MRVRVQVARSSADVLRCQYLIADVYSREYEVVFSKDRYDLDAKVEPWPHRYLMVMDGDELAATCGLYLRDTYVQRFGKVTLEDVRGHLTEAGADRRYHPARQREIAKVVVGRKYRGRGLSTFLIGAAHARDFCQLEAEAPHLLVFCARASITRNVHHRAGLRTRVLGPFPWYKVHELYRSDTDPMDSRLIIPDLDIPPRWYGLAVPGEYDTEQLTEGCR